MTGLRSVAFLLHFILPSTASLYIRVPVKWATVFLLFMLTFLNSSIYICIFLFFLIKEPLSHIASGCAGLI